MNKKIGISGDEKIWDAFKKYCEEMGFDYSKRVFFLVKEDMKKNSKK